MVIGIDIGGTKILILRLKRNKIVGKRKYILKKKNTEEIFNIIYSFSGDFKDKKIGIGIPGMKIKKDYFCPNLPKFSAYKLKKKLEKLGYKVKLENDANCFALTNYYRHKIKNMIAITLGTGFGGGIIINGKLYKGRNNAGEFGRIFLDNSKECEYFIGFMELARIYKEFTKKAMTPEKIFELAKKGDKEAIRVFIKYGKLVGIVISNLIYIFDPEAIVLGGGILKSKKFFKESMLKEIKRRVIFNIPKILYGEYEDIALGACFLFK